MKETSTIKAGVGHEPRHLRHPADVLDAIGIGEAEILVEPMSDVVAVEQISVTAEGMQPLLDAGWRWSICPAPDSPVNHNDARPSVP